MMATQMYLFIFTSKIEEMIQFDEYFSDGLVKNHQPEMFLKILMRRILHPSQTRHMRPFLSPIKQRSQKRWRWKKTSWFALNICKFMKLMKKHIRINNVYYSHIFNKNRGLQPWFTPPFIPRFTVLGGVPRSHLFWECSMWKGRGHCQFLRPLARHQCFLPWMDCQLFTVPQINAGWWKFHGFF